MPGASPPAVIKNHNIMKKVIQRNLPLTVKYSLIGISYQSIEDGGACCDNCGRVISNIASVKADSKYYNIGTDCLETLLLNNNLLDSESHLKWLHSDKPAIAKAKSLRAKILKQTKINPTFEASLYTGANRNTFGFSYSAEFTRERLIRNEDNSGFKRDSNDNLLTERTTEREPIGFDFTFNIQYKELTLQYVKDLPAVKFPKPNHN